MSSVATRSRRKRYDPGRSARYRGGHRMLRRSLEPVVAAGLARCVRCGGLIEPGSPWDLGHDDLNPAVHSGPEHASCNRGAPHRNKTSRQW